MRLAKLTLGDHTRVLVPSRDAIEVTIVGVYDTKSDTGGYVGALGRHLFRAHEVNPALPGPGALTPRKPYGALYGFNQSINERANEGNSHFNSLQTRTTT